jgi:hypothetical protein
VDVEIHFFFYFDANREMIAQLHAPPSLPPVSLDRRLVGPKSQSGQHGEQY